MRGTGLSSFGARRADIAGAYSDGRHIIVAMESGIEVRFPVADNPRLAAGTLEQLNRIELSPFGLHWPDLDEDLSFRGIMQGNYGQRRGKADPGTA